MIAKLSRPRFVLSASAFGFGRYNTNLGLDNSRYHAQPHPIIAYYYTLVSPARFWLAISTQLISACCVSLKSYLQTVDFIHVELTSYRQTIVLCISFVTVELSSGICIIKQWKYSHLSHDVVNCDVDHDVMGIRASGISIPLSLLMLLGWDNGMEIPEARMPTIKKHNNRRTVRQRTAEGTTHRNSEDRNAPITAAGNQPITVEDPT